MEKTGFSFDAYPFIIEFYVLFAAAQPDRVGAFAMS